MSQTVGSIMTRDIVTANSRRTVFEAAVTMTERRVGCLIVISGDHPVGIITERNVLRRVVAAGLDPKAVTVAEIMSKPLVTTSPDTTVRDAARMMVKQGVRRLPVVEDERLVGILTSTDLAKYLSESRQTLGSVLDLVDAPSVRENQPSCQSFKADPDLPRGNVWDTCGACYWHLDGYCVKEPLRLIRSMAS